MRRLASPRDIVDTLGGCEAVAKLTRANNVKSVYHWIDVGMFPARTYANMLRALKRKGCDASPRLWNMIGFEKSDAA